MNATGSGSALRQALVLAWRARPWAVFLYLALSMAAGMVPVGAAWLTKLVLDGLGAGARPVDLVVPVLGLAVVGVLAATVADGARYLGAELRRAVRLAGQDRLFEAVGRLHGIARFEDPEFLDRLQLAQQEGRTAPSRIVAGSLGVVQGGVTLLGFLAALLVISPLMTGIVLAATVPVLVGEWVLAGRRAAVLTDNGQAMRRELFYSRVLVDVSAAKEVRLFGCGGFLRRRMRAESARINAAERGVDRREVGVQGGLALVGAVTAAAGLWWAVGRAAGGGLSIGDVTMFVAAVAGTQTTAASLVLHVAQIRESLLLFGHFTAIAGAGPDLPVRERPVPTPPLRGGIEFRDVWFRYTDDGPWVLRGLDLHLPAGQATALVGANGAGKSTVVKLLCRLYDPSGGSITWDGVDLRDLDPAELRRRIGAVFQDFMHYDLTGRENIALGDLDALDDPARVTAAARAGGVHDILGALPYGYDTLLSRSFSSESDKQDPETGIVLSGGQWQRVALSRAFLRDRCDLMIMDEPSSGLDAEAEYRLTEQLREHRAGRTSVLISHRFGTLRDADHIVVLADGLVAERGRHAALMAAGGEYARLFDLQARGYRSDSDGGEPLDALAASA